MTLILALFAVFFLAQLLCYGDGMFGVLSRLRRIEWLPFDCYYCDILLASIAVGLLSGLNTVELLAVAGGVLLLSHWWDRQ